MTDLITRPADDLAALKADVERYTTGLRAILDTTKSPEYLLTIAVSMLANGASAERHAAAEIASLRVQIENIAAGLAAAEEDRDALRAAAQQARAALNGLNAISGEDISARDAVRALDEALK